MQNELYDNDTSNTPCRWIGCHVTLLCAGVTMSQPVGRGGDRSCCTRTSVPGRLTLPEIAAQSWIALVLQSWVPTNLLMVSAFALVALPCCWVGRDRTPPARGARACGRASDGSQNSGVPACDVAFVTAAGQHSRARPRAASVRGMLGLAPSLSGPPDALLRVVAVRRRAAVAKHSSQQRHVPALDGVGRIRRGNGFLLGHGLTGVLGASRLRGSLLVAACSRTVTRRENPLSLPRYSGRPIRNNVDAGKGVVWLHD